MSDRIGLESNAPELRLSVGESATLQLTVTNLSDVVDAFDLTLRNLNDSWYTLTPTRVSLFPHDSVAVELNVNPPAQMAAMAGAYPFQVVATSRDAPTESTLLMVQLYVAPVSELKMELEPQRIKARQGNFTLRLTNEGNIPRPTVLRPTDADGLLVFAFGKARTGALADAARKRTDGGVSVGQDVTAAMPVMLPSALETEWAKPNSQDAQGALELTLPAASIVELPMHVETNKRIWLGRQQSLKVEVKATPPGVEWEEKDAKKISGELIYDPYLAAWSGLPMNLQRLLMVVAALAILGLLLFLLFNPLSQTNASNPGANASATMTAAASSAAATQTALAKAAAGGGAGAAAAAATLTALAGAGGGAVDSASATQTAEALLSLLTPRPSGLPKIDKFDLEFAPDGSSQTAVWAVSDAITVTINGAKVEPTGSQVVVTNTDQSLVLIAANGKGQISRSLGLVLLRPPEIKSFAAEPAGPVVAGSEVTLRWTTTGAEQVLLEGTPVPDTDRETGSVKINPSASTDVVLTAQNAIGQVQSSVIIPVIPPTPKP